MEPPRRLGFYVLRGKIGEGGMGRVYRAVDRRDGSCVAIKLLSVELQGQPDQRLRFLREAQIAQRIEHPNVVRVHEFGEVHLHGVDRTLFIAMELVAGRDLYQHMSFAELGQRRVVEIGCQIAAALAAAQQAGVVHRDLKPHNVLVTSEGRAKLLDFGLAKLVDEAEIAVTEAGVVAGDELSGTTQLSQVGALIGTPGYAAPEQLRGEPTSHQSDLFSLGALLYQLITHRLPFRGQTASELLEAMERGGARPVSELAPGVSPQLERIVMRLLELDAHRRPRTAAAVERELVALLADDGAPALDRPFLEEESGGKESAGLVDRFKAWRRERKDR